MNSNHKGFSLIVIIGILLLVSAVGFAGWRVYDSNKNKNQSTTANKTEKKEQSKEQNKDGTQAEFGELKIAGLKSTLRYPLTQDPVKEITTIDESTGEIAQKETFVAKYQFKEVTLKVFKTNGLIIQQGAGPPLTCAYNKSFHTFSLAPGNEYAAPQSCDFKPKVFDGIQFLNNNAGYESVYVTSYISPVVENNFLFQISTSYASECYGNASIPEATCTQKISENQKKVDNFVETIVKANKTLFR